MSIKLPDIHKIINDLLIRSQDLGLADISHEELGKANGFHEANYIKNELAEYIHKILVETDKYLDSINEPILNESLGHIENIIIQVNELIKNADSTHKCNGWVDS